MRLTKYKRHPIPELSECQRPIEHSKTSTEKTAPDIAPTAAPRMKPLSVFWPIKAPLIVHNKAPTANKTSQVIKP
jgi:hypothetical protein